MEQRYRETKVKEDKLRREGFEVITKWSCDFAKDKNNPEVKKIHKYFEHPRSN